LLFYKIQKQNRIKIKSDSLCIKIPLPPTMNKDDVFLSLSLLYATSGKQVEKKKKSSGRSTTTHAIITAVINVIK